MPNDLTPPPITPGTRWVQTDESPWPRVHGHSVTVREVGKGWVRYGIPGLETSDMREREDVFRRCYAFMGPADETEFQNWAELVKAGDVLRAGLERRDPEAINTVRTLAALLDVKPEAELRRWPEGVAFPEENRLASGPPPF